MTRSRFVPALRTLTTGAAALALLLPTTEANAAELEGVYSRSRDFARTVGDDRFSAAVDVEAKATVSDFAKLCASSSPSVYCAGTTGAAYNLCATIATVNQATFCGKRGYGMSARAGASVDARLFGKSIDLLDIEASASADSDGVATRYGIWMGGKKLASASGFGSLLQNRLLGERSFASAEKTYMFGVVPITVKAEAVGSAGINVDLRASTSGVYGNATPTASVDAVFSAGVDALGVGAGVTGDLLLVRLRTPGTAELKPSGTRSFAYNAALDLRLSALYGDVDLYAEGFGQREEWKVFGWNGFYYEQNLGRIEGTLAF